MGIEVKEESILPTSRIMESSIPKIKEAATARKSQQPGFPSLKTFSPIDGEHDDDSDEGMRDYDSVESDEDAITKKDEILPPVRGSMGEGSRYSKIHEHRWRRPTNASNGTDGGGRCLARNGETERKTDAGELTELENIGPGGVRLDGPYSLTEEVGRGGTAADHGSPEVSISSASHPTSDDEGSHVGDQASITGDSDDEGSGAGRRVGAVGEGNAFDGAEEVKREDEEGRDVMAADRGSRDVSTSSASRPQSLHRQGSMRRRPLGLTLDMEEGMSGAASLSGTGALNQGAVAAYAQGSKLDEEDESVNGLQDSNDPSAVRVGGSSRPAFGGHGGPSLISSSSSGRRASPGLMLDVESLPVGSASLSGVGATNPNSAQAVSMWRSGLYDDEGSHVGDQARLTGDSDDEGSGAGRRVGAVGEGDAFDGAEEVKRENEEGRDVMAADRGSRDVSTSSASRPQSLHRQGSMRRRPLGLTLDMEEGMSGAASLSGTGALNQGGVAAYAQGSKLDEEDESVNGLQDSNDPSAMRVGGSSRPAFGGHGGPSLISSSSSGRRASPGLMLDVESLPVGSASLSGVGATNPNSAQAVSMWRSGLYDDEGSHVGDQARLTGDSDDEGSGAGRRVGAVGEGDAFDGAEEVKRESEEGRDVMAADRGSRDVSTSSASRPQSLHRQGSMRRRPLGLTLDMEEGMSGAASLSGTGALNQGAVAAYAQGSKLDEEDESVNGLQDSNDPSAMRVGGSSRPAFGGHGGPSLILSSSSGRRASPGLMLDVESLPVGSASLSGVGATNPNSAQAVSMWRSGLYDDEGSHVGDQARLTGDSDDEGSGAGRRVGAIGEGDAFDGAEEVKRESEEGRDVMAADRGSRDVSTSSASRPQSLHRQGSMRRRPLGLTLDMEEGMSGAASLSGTGALNQGAVAAYAQGSKLDEEDESVNGLQDSNDPSAMRVGGSSRPAFGGHGGPSLILSSSSGRRASPGLMLDVESLPVGSASLSGVGATNPNSAQAVSMWRSGLYDDEGSHVGDQARLTGDSDDEGSGAGRRVGAVGEGDAFNGAEEVKREDEEGRDVMAADRGSRDVSTSSASRPQSLHRQGSMRRRPLGLTLDMEEGMSGAASLSGTGALNQGAVAAYAQGSKLDEEDESVNGLQDSNDPSAVRVGGSSRPAFGGHGGPSLISSSSSGRRASPGLMLDVESLPVGSASLSGVGATNPNSAQAVSMWRSGLYDDEGSHVGDQARLTGDSDDEGSGAGRRVGAVGEGDAFDGAEEVKREDEEGRDVMAADRGSRDVSTSSASRPQSLHRQGSMRRRPLGLTLDMEEGMSGAASLSGTGALNQGVVAAYAQGSKLDEEDESVNGLQDSNDPSAMRVGGSSRPAFGGYGGPSLILSSSSGRRASPGLMLDVESLPVGSASLSGVRATNPNSAQAVSMWRSGLYDDEGSHVGDQASLTGDSDDEGSGAGRRVHTGAVGEGDAFDGAEEVKREDEEGRDVMAADRGSRDVSTSSASRPQSLHRQGSMRRRPLGLTLDMEEGMSGAASLSGTGALNQGVVAAYAQGSKLDEEDESVNGLQDSNDPSAMRVGGSSRPAFGGHGGPSLILSSSSGRRASPGLMLDVESLPVGSASLSGVGATNPNSAQAVSMWRSGLYDDEGSHVGDQARLTGDSDDEGSGAGRRVGAVGEGDAFDGAEEVKRESEEGRDVMAADRGSRDVSTSSASRPQSLHRQGSMRRRPLGLTLDMEEGMSGAASLSGTGALNQGVVAAYAQGSKLDEEDESVNGLQDSNDPSAVRVGGSSRPAFGGHGGPSLILSSSSGRRASPGLMLDVESLPVGSASLSGVGATNPNSAQAVSMWRSGLYDDEGSHVGDQARLTGDSDDEGSGAGRRVGAVGEGDAFDGAEEVKREDEEGRDVMAADRGSRDVSTSSASRPQSLHRQGSMRRRPLGLTLDMEEGMSGAASLSGTGALNQGVVAAYAQGSKLDEEDESVNGLQDSNDPSAMRVGGSSRPAFGGHGGPSLILSSSSGRRASPGLMLDVESLPVGSASLSGVGATNPNSAQAVSMWRSGLYDDEGSHVGDQARLTGDSDDEGSGAGRRVGAVGEGDAFDGAEEVKRESEEGRDVMAADRGSRDVSTSSASHPQSLHRQGSMRRRPLGLTLDMEEGMSGAASLSGTGALNQGVVAAYAQGSKLDEEDESVNGLQDSNDPSAMRVGGSSRPAFGGHGGPSLISSSSSGRRASPGLMLDVESLPVGSASLSGVGATNPNSAQAVSMWRSGLYDDEGSHVGDQASLTGDSDDEGSGAGRRVGAVGEGDAFDGAEEVKREDEEGRDVMAADRGSRDVSTSSASRPQSLHRQGSMRRRPLGLTLDMEEGMSGAASLSGTGALNQGVVAAYAQGSKLDEEDESVNGLQDSNDPSAVRVGGSSRPAFGGHGGPSLILSSSSGRRASPGLMLDVESLPVGSASLSGVGATNPNSAQAVSMWRSGLYDDEGSHVGDQASLTGDSDDEGSGAGRRVHTGAVGEGDAFDGAEEVKREDEEGRDVMAADRGSRDVSTSSASRPQSLHRQGSMRRRPLGLTLDMEEGMSGAASLSGTGALNQGAVAAYAQGSKLDEEDESVNGLQDSNDPSAMRVGGSSRPAFGGHGGPSLISSSSSGRRASPGLMLDVESLPVGSASLSGVGATNPNSAQAVSMWRSGLYDDEGSHVGDQARLTGDSDDEGSGAGRRVHTGAAGEGDAFDGAEEVKREDEEGKDVMAADRGSRDVSTSSASRPQSLLPSPNLGGLNWIAQATTVHDAVSQNSSRVQRLAQAVDPDNPWAHHPLQYSNPPLVAHNPAGHTVRHQNASSIETPTSTSHRHSLIDPSRSNSDSDSDYDSEDEGAIVNERPEVLAVIQIGGMPNDAKEQHTSVQNRNHESPSRGPSGSGDGSDAADSSTVLDLDPWGVKPEDVVLSAGNASPEQASVLATTSDGGPVTAKRSSAIATISVTTPLTSPSSTPQPITPVPSTLSLTSSPLPPGSRLSLLSLYSYTTATAPVEYSGPKLHNPYPMPSTASTASVSDNEEYSEEHSVYETNKHESDDELEVSLSWDGQAAQHSQSRGVASPTFSASPKRTSRRHSLELNLQPLSNFNHSPSRRASTGDFNLSSVKSTPLPLSPLPETSTLSKALQIRPTPRAEPPRYRNTLSRRDSSSESFSHASDERNSLPEGVGRAQNRALFASSSSRFVPSATAVSSSSRATRASSLSFSSKPKAPAAQAEADNIRERIEKLKILGRYGVISWSRFVKLSKRFQRRLSVGQNPPPSTTAKRRDSRK